MWETPHIFIIGGSEPKEKSTYFLRTPTTFGENIRHNPAGEGRGGGFDRDKVILILLFSLIMIVLSSHKNLVFVLNPNNFW